MKRYDCNNFYYCSSYCCSNYYCSNYYCSDYCCSKIDIDLVSKTVLQ